MGMPAGGDYDFRGGGYAAGMGTESKKAEIIPKRDKMMIVDGKLVY